MAAPYAPLGYSHRDVPHSGGLTLGALMERSIGGLGIFPQPELTRAPAGDGLAGYPAATDLFLVDNLAERLTVSAIAALIRILVASVRW
jgi:hypothetical protein